METVIRVQIQDEASCVSLCINTLRKGMGNICFHPSHEKIGMTSFSSFGKATDQGEGKLWIQTGFTPLK